MLFISGDIYENNPEFLIYDFYLKEMIYTERCCWVAGV